MTNIEFKIVSNRVILKVKELTISKRWIRDKFRLQKLGVMKGFFKVKVLSNFDFGAFWRYWLQRHLVGKVLWVRNSPGHYQYVSLVCKTYSKSQEDCLTVFFILKWTVRCLIRPTTTASSMSPANPGYTIMNKFYFSLFHSLVFAQ